MGIRNQRESTRSRGSAWAVFAALVATLAPCAVFAQVDLLAGGDLAGFQFDGGTFATAEVIEVDGLPFSRAVRITVSETPDDPWQVQLLSPTIAAINPRDALVAGVWIRRADSPARRGLVDLVFEQSSEPYTRALTEPLTPTREWRRVAVPLLAFQGHGPGAAKYDFQLGYQEQVIEIGGFELLDYGPLGVLGTDSVDLFALSDGGFGAGEIVQVVGQPFDRAWRIATTTQPQNPWDIQLTTTLGPEIATGETVALVFSYRDVAGSGAKVSAVVEFEGDPWQQSFASTVEGDADWRRVVVPFEIEGVSPTGRWAIRFQLGRQIQEVEIGGIELIDFGTTLDSSELNASLPYSDRSPLAPWRERAWRRIRRHRMAELRVLVGDLAANPLPGAEVDVRLDRHAFGFGTAIAGFRLLSDVPDDLIYQSKLREHFNMAVSENFLKWIPWEAQPQSFAVNVVDWLVENELRVRGHNLVWPSWSLVPDDVSGLFGDELRTRVIDHIVEETGYPGIVGRIEDWDVVNEAFTHHDIQDRLDGNAVLEDWMQAAHDTDPNARLFLNDFSILTDGGGTPKEDYYHDLVSDWIARGVPIDGMGFQAHFRYGLTPMERIYATLERFGALGLRLSISEFDHDIQDRLLQADFLEDFMTLAFSHPNVDSFLMWGFWDGSHWLDNAPLYDTDWTLKPSGAAWRNLVENIWHTEQSGTTNAAGRFAVQGFHGEYSIRARFNGVEKVVTTTLEPGGTLVRIRLDLSGNVESNTADPASTESRSAESSVE